MTNTGALPRPRVALVDDDESILWVGQELLGLAGCDVRTYSTPVALLTDLAYRTFDAYVIDWHLGRCTAEDLISTLRSDPSAASAQIILLTGESDPDSVPALAAAHTRHRCAVLTKPTPWRTVYDVLAGQLPVPH